jgi:tRNA-2-methylthio-N6-dimethylallyladenosine synthase
MEKSSTQPVLKNGKSLRSVYIHTFGCQMNVNDTDRILQVLEPHGFSPATEPAQANLIILNTCSVREKAENKMLSELGRLAPLKEYNEDLILSVSGCVAQQEGKKLLAKVPYLDLVFGPDNISQLPELLERVRGSKERVAETSFFKRKDYKFIEAEPRTDEGRVCDFVTIMKGCDKVCSFCIVPFTRGREVSKPADMVVREVEKLVAAGIRDVTLLGQNVNSYGKDKNREVHFAELLRQVDKVEGLERLRFTTSHPSDCTDELVSCFGDLNTLCEFFHLPVQSGSDRVLETMRRPYTVAHYMGRVAALRARCPDISLSTDIIVGYPGETEEEHQMTMQLLETVRYDSIFAFNYSPRPGTRAAKCEDDVPLAVKKRRLQEVLRLQDVITKERRQRYLGRTEEVLFEGPSRASRNNPVNEWQITGRTRSNLIVNVPVPVGSFWSNRWVGELGHVKITELKSNSLYGLMA